MNKTLKILGWSICIITFLGIMFKMMHWPGASLFLLLYPFLMIFFYLPVWLNNELKTSSWKFFSWAQYITINIWVLAAIFKIMHWPGASPMYYLLLFLVSVILLPSFLIYLRKGKKRGEAKNLHFTFIFILVALNFFLYATGSVSKGTINSLINNSSQIENSHSSVCKKNKLLYTSLEEILQDSLKNKDERYKKCLKLKSYVDSTDKYVRATRNKLIALVEEVSEVSADSISIKDVNDKLNIDLTTTFFFFTNGNSATELRNRIGQFRDSVLKFVPEEKQNFIKEGIQLNTEDVYDENYGETISWERATFEYIPLSSVLTTLISIELEIRNAEQQVLTELFNELMAGQSNNVAAKFAEYGMKYENEKKQKEIELLKKDKELKNEIIQTKNEAIQAQENTIAFFIIGLLFAIVLVFYIIRSNIQRKKANTLLEKQKHQIEIQKQEITDSISYAKRLQTAILPDEKEITSHLPNSFVLYQPKDIVSGDFYFFKHKNKSSYVAAADCTGHGVPGAFMSVVCSEKLNQAVTEKNAPSEILNILNQLVKHTLKQTNADTSTRDGMDVCLCKIEGNKVSYSGANRPLWIIRNGNNAVEEIKATKVAIGGYTEDNQVFQESTLEFQKGDTIYLLSDGYADQFGGEQAKKLTTKRMKELLLSIHQKPLSEQRNELATFMEKWKGINEQVDDILVIGIKF